MGNLFQNLSANLLDLGLRNKLINFKDIRLKSIRIEQPTPDVFFDNLRNINKLEFVPSNKEDLDEEEQSLIDEPAIEEQLLRKNQIIAYKKSDSYVKVLRSIKKYNDSMMSEKGINVLYTAFGFLEWKEVEYSDVVLKSPLLLIPCNLSLDNQCFYLSRSDDEVIVNPTLKAKLQLDFGLSLTEFDDENDTLVTYLKKVYDLISAKKDWDVKDHSYIGIFSFAKLTMYEDLKEHELQMQENKLISSIYNGEHVINTCSSDYTSYFQQNKDIYLHNVVDADSSQIKAIQEVASGRSIVIQGPPGTGKSQTITNIISELLYRGKTVLFVSEKQAALNVVYNNLKKVGLEQFCLQLHSDKSNKKEFIQQIYESLNVKNLSATNRYEQIDSMMSYKRQLDNYSKSLYTKVPVIELTPFEIINRLASLKGYGGLKYKFEEILSKSLLEFMKDIDVLDKYSSYSGAIEKEYWKCPWYGFISSDYHFSMEDTLLEEIKFVRDFALYGSSLSREIKQVINIQLDSIADVQNNLDLVSIYKDLKIYDKELLNYKSIVSIKKLLPNLLASKKESNSLSDLINEKYRIEVSNLDINALLTRFIVSYKSFFRTFNKDYKRDVSAIISYRKELTNKYKYSEIVDDLKTIKKYADTQENISSIAKQIKSITDYDYNALSVEDLELAVAYIDKLSQFDDFDSLIVDENVAFDDIVSNCNKAFTFYSAKDAVVRFVNIQNYFRKENFDFTLNCFDCISEKANLCIEKYDLLSEWNRFDVLLTEIKKRELEQFVVLAIENQVPSNSMCKHYSYQYYYQWLLNIIYTDPTLKTFTRDNQDRCVNLFANADKALLKAAQNDINATLTHKISNLRLENNSNNSDLQRQLRIVMHEANKKRQIKPIRTMFNVVPDIIHIAKPCILMSPLSVSTYLNYNPKSFDVVIFDEASQIFPWDAIGSISRAQQIVVVGDSKQMPPTNFFMTSTDGDDEEYDEEKDESASDFESILDLCTVALPQTLLNWHYRSRNEDLIAFSNKYFYGNKLVTFPSSSASKPGFGIDFTYVKNGVFKGRQNLNEAMTVVNKIFEHFEKYPDRSLGVVCFSINQQNLIEELLENVRRKDDRFSALFDPNKNEPFFIKNLETVQGDERDTMIFSIGYGKDAYGNLKHNFGPLNRQGGGRRLNVAITRAKYNLIVVSSIHGFDIDLERTKAEGAHLLKEFLNIAENGVSVLDKDPLINPSAEAESPFEENVADYIREQGYQVDLQVGCSNFRIDICVKHPEHDDYVLAVECDGATYHSGVNTRDRDRLRQEILERMGWNFYRIWSTDWFMNNKREKLSLLEKIKEAINDYDLKVKMKEDLSLNPIIVEENNDDILDGASLISTPEKATPQGKFIDRLDSEQRSFVLEIQYELFKLDSRLHKVNTEYFYGFYLANEKLSQYGAMKNVWIWFRDKNGKLIIRYRDNPIPHTKTETHDIDVVIDDFDNILAKLENVVKTFISPEKDLSENEESITNVEEEITPENKEAENKPENEHSKLQKDTSKQKTNVSKYVEMSFYSFVSSAIQGQRRRDLCPFEELKQEVVAYILGEMCAFGIESKAFSSKEDFATNMYKKRIVYNIYGVFFTIGNLDLKTVREIYCLYKANKIVEKIKEYEKMMNVTIISDYKECMKTMYHLISSGNSELSKVSGLTSNFALVPDESINEIVNSFDF